jgi:superfamily II DNA or RNA helicase
MPAVLSAADKRLTEVRRHMPDAGGLVISGDQNTARAYAKTLREITGEAPTVVLSDEKAASKKIAKFSEGDSRWMVAVRMVSEGVDVPRLAVGVYATPTSTPLFFAQAVGRFVRARKRGETASVFVPSVTRLLSFAAEMEVERDHVLGRKNSSEDGDIFALEDELIAQANKTEAASDELEAKFEALGSDASFDRVVFDGGDYGTGGDMASDEELDFLGLPGLLEPDQVRELLRKRQAKSLAAQKRSQRGSTDREDPTPTELATHEQVSLLRRELNGLVAAWHHRSGQPHGVIHNDLRRKLGGPAAAHASSIQLKERIELIRDWATQRRA